MIEIISKELLREVLNINPLIKINDLRLVGLNLCWKNSSIYSVASGEIERINVYELAFRCRQWALKNKYNNVHLVNESLCFKIYFSYLEDNYKDKKYSEIFYGFTEFEATFKACQWILDNKDK